MGTDPSAQSVWVRGMPMFVLNGYEEPPTVMPDKVERISHHGVLHLAHNRSPFDPQTGYAIGRARARCLTPTPGLQATFEAQASLRRQKVIDLATRAPDDLILKALQRLAPTGGDDHRGPSIERHEGKSPFAQRTAPMIRVGDPRSDTGIRE